jgi:Dehydratase family
MDAKTNFRARLPSRQVTGEPERAPHCACDRAVGSTAAVGKLAFGGMSDAHMDRLRQDEVGDQFFVIGSELCDVADVFKRSPCSADLKPAGRDVAKDLFEAGGVPLLMKTLLHDGFLHGDCFVDEEACFAAVKTRQDREGDVLVIRQEGPKGGPEMREILATTVALSSQGAVTHPGSAREVRSYADI